MEKLYSISEVADKLGLSTKTLRRWEESGKFLGSRTLGNQRRYSLTDLQILDAIKHGIISGSRDLLTIDQAASLFGVTPATISRWEESGKIHPLITAGITYYPRHRLLSQMDSLKSSLSTPEPIFDNNLDRPSPVVDTPSPSLHRSLAPLETHLTLPALPTTSLSPLFINIVITLLILFAYHFLFATPKAVPSPSAPALNQASTPSRDPSLTVLDSLLDSAGNFKPRSVTTNSLLLSPASPPESSPGTLYFDASSQSLRIFKNGSWTDVSPIISISTDSAHLISGTGVVPKGKDQISVTNDKVSSNTPLSLTFNSDFSPAKKYWITLSKGGFTVHTDFPVGVDSSFTYLIVTPK